jgi:hypothetical protein
VKRSRRLVAALVLVAGAGCSSGAAEPTTTTTTPTTTEPSAAAAPEVAWAVTLSGPTGEDDIDGVGAGDDGSLWVTGKFERRAVLGGRALVSAGRADIPVARFSADGEPSWVQRFGGPGEDNLFDLDVGPDGAVATGWFDGEVAFGDEVLRSAGGPDCVVVAIDDDGGVRWARSFGGPGAEGCNEVVVGDDGSVVTSMDVLVPGGRDTVLLRLDADGEQRWSRTVGGPGSQRGKALALAPDGAVAFGGDTTGDVVVDGASTAVPGEQADAWVSSWDPDGTLRWVQAWGGPGPDLAKGVAFDGDGVVVEGSLSGSTDVAGIAYEAGPHPEVGVARLDLDGRALWLSVVRGGTAVEPTEISAWPSGGVVGGFSTVSGMEVVAADGSVTAIDAEASSSVLLRWAPDGTVASAWPVAGATTGRAGELAVADGRVYLDLVVRGGDRFGSTTIETQGKDSAVVAIDVDTT